MTPKNGNKKHPIPIDGRIKREMAEPRITKSAKIALLKLESIERKKQRDKQTS
jgi:hypothetical protein